MLFFPMINFLYFYISTLRSVSAVPNLAVFSISLMSCLLGMLVRYLFFEECLDDSSCPYCSCYWYHFHFYFPNKLFFSCKGLMF